jgi:transcription antitermination factor NusG
MMQKKGGMKSQRYESQKGGKLLGADRNSASDRRNQLEQGARRINRAARQYMRDQRFIWHVLFVPPQKEYIAQKIISQWIDVNNNCPNGHPSECVYLPLNARWRRENRFTRKKKRFAYPVVPGCLFFATQVEVNCWYELLKLHIVSGVMSIANKPVCISGRDVEQFVNLNREEIEHRLKHPFDDRPKPLVCGDQANVIDGPFEGYLVDIKTINGESAKILLKFLGSNQEVYIATGRLKNVS